jgi:hypothetical protein
MKFGKTIDEAQAICDIAEHSEAVLRNFSR